MQVSLTNCLLCTIVLLLFFLKGNPHFLFSVSSMIKESSKCAPVTQFIRSYNTTTYQSISEAKMFNRRSSYHRTFGIIVFLFWIRPAYAEIVDFKYDIFDNILNVWISAV